MRTPEEILTLFHWSVDTEHDLRIINQIQKEAWNEAIEAAAESATTKWGQSVIQVDKQSILKLRK